MTKSIGHIIFVSMVLLLSCKASDKEGQLEWIFVEGGTFEQGQNQFLISPGGDTIHGFCSPNREVSISDFYISKYEISSAQFRQFCINTGRKMPTPPVYSDYGDSLHYNWEDNKPMLATWEEAHAYAIWAGGRLPTEAEWEYAAKGGNKSKGYKYSGSNEPIEIAWVAENSDSSFHDIGLLKANELGIHDMTGNITEWVSDWYNPQADSLSSLQDPKGPPKKDNNKIAKGVSWYYDAYDEKGKALEYGIHMPEVRYQSPTNTRNTGFGFRIAKDK